MSSSIALLLPLLSYCSTQGLVMNLVLMDLALAVQKALVILLSLPLRWWDYKHVPDFLQGSSAFMVNTLTTKPSS